VNTLQELLALIRRRPELYLGERSLSALWHLIDGYQIGFVAAGGSIKPDQALPDDFHDWVAYRLHFKESTSGWRNMILNKENDEAKALSRFFELYDDHTCRKAQVFAKLSDIQKTYSVGAEGRERVERYPRGLSFVTYTTDPGFFVYSDEPGTSWHDRFYPTIDRFEIFHKVERTEFTILDQGAFARLSADKG
jgi:hypothetical protein